MKSALAMLLLLVSLCFLVGCVDVDGSKVHFQVEPNLRGKIKLEFVGIHGEPADMQDFYKTYQDNASQMINDWKIEEPVTKLDNKTDTRCDGSIQGNFENLVVTLGPLLEGADYEIKKDAGTFSLKLKPEKETDSKISLSIQYSGKVLSSNAQKKDPQTGALQWDFSTLDPSGIQFTLGLK
jgi:hypothetical protein